jgi:hypothetical protein
MAGLSQPNYNVVSVEPSRQREVIELFASNGSFSETARILELDNQTVRRIVKSPQGSFALEQLLRERARTRALKLGALTDKTIDEFETCLTNGNERILNGRRDSDPLTVFLRPDLRDLTNALAWMTHHMREISETLSAIDVTNHDVSHEARSHNLATLKELVALEERRLAVDNERQVADDAAHDPPVVDTFASTPYSRNSWGGNRSVDPQRQSHRTHKDRWPDALAARAQQDIRDAREALQSDALPSPRDGDTVPQSCSSVPDAAGCMSVADTSAHLMLDSRASTVLRQPHDEATLMHAARENTGESGPSRNRPPTPRPAREAAPETSPVLGDSRGSSSEVTWEDLEEE